MGKLKYEVRSKEKGKLVPIYVHYQDSNNHFRLKTPLLTRQEYWNQAKETIKPVYFDEVGFSIEQQKLLVKKYQDLKNHLERNITFRVMMGEQVDKLFFQDSMDEFFGKKKISKTETLNQYMKRYVKEITSGERMHQHRGVHIPSRYTEGTIKNYEGFVNIWGLFTKKKPLDFDDVTDDVYKNFIMYCINKDLATNTIGRHIKNLKTIMKCAKKDKLHNNLDYENFNVPREDVFNIYLTEDELKKMYDLELTGRDEIIRDVFLIGCFTLQRFSDFIRISPDMISSTEEGVRVITLIQKKTGTRVVIPLRPTLTTLLEKYDYRVPRVHEQKMNDRIKEIARDADILDKIQITKQKGGILTTNFVEKCELVKTHTCRRSGCTNLYKDGIPTLDIMKISGHKTEREFLRYILVGPDETADRLGKNPDFNKPSW